MQNNNHHRQLDESSESDLSSSEDYIEVPSGALPFLGPGMMNYLRGRPGMGTDPFGLGLADRPMFGQQVEFTIPMHADDPFAGLDPLSRALYGALAGTLRHQRFGEGECEYDEITGRCVGCDKLDPNDTRTPFERQVCSNEGCHERMLMEATDSFTGEIHGWVCAGEDGCQRKWDCQGNEVELISQSIYLAGDWLEPPLETARAFEAAGCRIVHKWWTEEERGKTATLNQLSDHIERADWFVLDMRSVRFGSHPFGGSHIGVGMAHEQGAKIMVIAPTEEPKRTYTSLLTPFVVDSVDGALEVLRQERYGLDEDSDNDWLDEDIEEEGVIRPPPPSSSKARPAPMA